MQNHWHQFKAHTLVHNHRQGEGAVWTTCLNRIRTGTHTEEDLNVLRSRLSTGKFESQDAEHVMYTREKARNHNSAMLNALKSEVIELTAVNRGPKGWRVPKPDSDGNVRNTQFKQKLILKKGARINHIHNIDTVDDLVNGEAGTIIGFERFPDGEVEAVMVKFDRECVGINQREKFRTLSAKYKEGNVTPIKRFLFESMISLKLS